MRRLLLLLLLCLTINVSAQGERLRLDQMQEVAITAEAAGVRPYQGLRGETIRVTAEAVDAGANTPDLVLWIVLNGRLLAYNDNQGESPNPSFSLYLPEDGRYLIYVDSFNGVSTGSAQVLVQRIDPFNKQVFREGTDRIVIDLPPSQVFRHEFGASSNFTITVRALSENVDPYIRFTTKRGEVIAVNDDHNTDDDTLGLLDSQLSASVRAAVYVLEVRDFLGNGGQVEITIRF